MKDPVQLNENELKETVPILGLEDILLTDDSMRKFHGIVEQSKIYIQIPLRNPSTKLSRIFLTKPRETFMGFLARYSEVEEINSMKEVKNLVREGMSFITPTGSYYIGHVQKERCIEVILPSVNSRKTFYEYIAKILESE